MAIGNLGIGGLRIPGLEGVDVEELVARSKRVPASRRVPTKPKRRKVKPKKKPATSNRRVSLPSNIRRRMLDIDVPRMPRSVDTVNRNERSKPPSREEIMSRVVDRDFRPGRMPNLQSKRTSVIPPFIREDLANVSDIGEKIGNIGMSGSIPGINTNIQEIIERATRTGSTVPTQQTQQTQTQPQTGGEEETDVTYKPIKEKKWKRPDPEWKMSDDGVLYDAAFYGYDTGGMGISGYDPETDTYTGYVTSGWSGQKTPKTWKGSELPKGWADAWKKYSTPSDSQQPGSGDDSTRKTLQELMEMLREQSKQKQQPTPQIPTTPQMPTMPNWNLGPSAPGPMRDKGTPKGPFMPSPMPPQMPSQMFGGYGGTAPIVPSMPYAGLGNFPQMPQMPAPQYDPNAEPGGPPISNEPIFT